MIDVLVSTRINSLEDLVLSVNGVLVLIEEFFIAASYAAGFTNQILFSIMNDDHVSIKSGGSLERKRATLALVIPTFVSCFRVFATAVTLAGSYWLYRSCSVVVFRCRSTLDNEN